MRKIAIAALLSVVTLGAVGLGANPAYARSGTGRVVLEGTGRLVADGRGTAVLNMGGVARLRISGDVLVEDHAGDLRVRIDGTVAESAGPDLKLDDFTGVVELEGTDFTLKAEGRIHLTARGHGVAVLEGHGFYWVGRDGPHRW